MPSEADTFLPSILSVFYAIFDPKHGPKVVYQVPEGLIIYNEPSDDEDEGQSSNTSNGPGVLASRDGTHETSASSTPSSTSLVAGSSAEDGSKPPAIAMRQSSNSPKTKRHISSPQKSLPTYNMSDRGTRNGTPPVAAGTELPESAEPAAETTRSPLFHFDDVSKYVIPSSALCGRLVICTMRQYSVIGFPVALRGKQYTRNFFRYNICFVFQRTADLSCYEPIVRKIGRVLTACEEESHFLSSDSTSPRIHGILEQLYEDLNSYSEASIPVDSFNSLELKLYPFYPNPPRVDDWSVPLAFINLAERIEPNWDITVARVCGAIDGVRYVKKIAKDVDVDDRLCREALEHLLYYRCIMLVDIFQYSNVYAFTRSIGWLADEEHVQAECGAYVTKPGYERPEWPKLFELYARFRIGTTVIDWQESNNIVSFGIDVRRFISFGIVKGFLRRVHRYPVLMASDETPSQDERELAPTPSASALNPANITTRTSGGGGTNGHGSWGSLREQEFADQTPPELKTIFPHTRNWDESQIRSPRRSTTLWDAAATPHANPTGLPTITTMSSAGSFSPLDSTPLESYHYPRDRDPTVYPRNQSEDHIPTPTSMTTTRNIPIAIQSSRRRRASQADSLMSSSLPNTTPMSASTFAPPSAAAAGLGPGPGATSGLPTPRHHRSSIDQPAPPSAFGLPSTANMPSRLSRTLSAETYDPASSGSTLPPPSAAMGSAFLNPPLSQRERDKDWYPPGLKHMLDGDHQTDELCTKFEVGWPILEKYLKTIGGVGGKGGKGGTSGIVMDKVDEVEDGYYGKVKIIYR
ncbi:NPR2-domain-containing protein [Sistotremastrum niveocremeum HHB9708]|uniref:NPR2-domain-containing protein n=1 Tax=Sistotremastrum niveocremeum HHB9708 TaxID=1314777 RepID=A0A164SL23_9AGAM|nr:NPR2-domain-containing protein [Sistotremastrum niveocremeum HHB9708]